MLISNACKLYLLFIDGIVVAPQFLTGTHTSAALRATMNIANDVVVEIIIEMKMMMPS